MCGALEPLCTDGTGMIAGPVVHKPPVARQIGHILPTQLTTEPPALVHGGHMGPLVGAAHKSCRAVRDVTLDGLGPVDHHHVLGQVFHLGRADGAGLHLLAVSFLLMNTQSAGCDEGLLADGAAMAGDLVVGLTLVSLQVPHFSSADDAS